MTDCNATTSEGEPCKLPAGWGTDHVGEGRCKLHGGASPRGEDHPQFEHGLFSDYLSDEDRQAIDALDEYGDVEKLDELIDWRLARLRRAVRELNTDDGEDFWRAFERLVQEGGRNGDPGLSAAQMGKLAKMLDRHNRALQEEIDLVRKLVKDRNKIAEGDDHNVSLRELFGGEAA
jgi:hypothetical protein